MYDKFIHPDHTVPYSDNCQSIPDNTRQYNISIESLRNNNPDLSNDSISELITSSLTGNGPYSLEMICDVVMHLFDVRKIIANEKVVFYRKGRYTRDLLDVQSILNMTVGSLRQNNAQIYEYRPIEGHPIYREYIYRNRIGLARRISTKDVKRLIARVRALRNEGHIPEMEKPGAVTTRICEHLGIEY